MNLKHFTKSLRFKVTLLVIMVELLAFTGVGFFYIRRFSHEIDKAIIARLSIPGLLMTRGELSFDAVSDRRTMEGLLHEPYSEGIVIGLDGLVYFSSDPARLDTHLEVIDGMKLPGPESPAVSIGAHDLITPVQDSTGKYLTCLSPLRPNGKLTGYLYLKVGTETLEAEKRNVSILFAIGSLATISLTAPILSLLLHLMVIRRLNYLVEIFPRFARGDYAARAHPSGGDDEITILMNGFNSLAKRLEDTVAHLSESESRFRVLVEHAPEAIVVYDVDANHFVDANKNAERLFACSLEQLRQANPTTFYAPVQPDTTFVEQSVQENSRRVLAGEEVVVERAIINATGQQLLCEVRLVHLPASNRRLIRASYLDITERKQAEVALRESQALYHSLVEQLPAGIFRKNAAGEYVYVNPWFCRLKGLIAEAFLGKTPDDVVDIGPAANGPNVTRINKQLAALGMEHHRQIMETGRTIEVEEQADGPDGKKQYFSVLKTPILDLDGKIVGSQGIMFDITELKRAEEKATQNQERFKLIFESIPIGVALARRYPDGRFERVINDAHLRICGLTREQDQIPGIYEKITHPEDVARQAELGRPLNDGGNGQFAMEKRYILPDGLVVWVTFTFRRRHCPDGSIEELSTVVDITERKRAEEELRRLTRFQQTILNSAPYGIVSTTPDGIITAFNPATERLLGYTAAEVIGKQTPATWHDPQEIEQYALRLSTELGEKIQPGFDVFTARPKRNLPEEHEWTYIRKDGTRVPVNLSITALRDDGGHVIGFVGMIYDITERKRTREVLLRLNEELEQRVKERTADLQKKSAEIEENQRALINIVEDLNEKAAALETTNNELATVNKELESFSYSVSHDLRAPLRSIDGFSRILLEEGSQRLDDNGKSNLDRIRAASQRMGHLIDDLLKLSRITRSELHRGPVNLSAIATDVANELKRLEPERQVEFVIEPGLSTTGDSHLLRIVLDNLFGNAWKFSGRRTDPKIEFGRMLKDGESVFFVHDNGVGFDMAYSNKLFGAFQRLHSNTEFPGTGIGLATVQRIIHRHGGRIWAQSEVDHGATFYFTTHRSESNPLIASSAGSNEKSRMRAVATNGLNNLSTPKN